MVILTVNEALAILPRNDGTDSSLVGAIEGIYCIGTLLSAVPPDDRRRNRRPRTPLDEG